MGDLSGRLQWEEEEAGRGRRAGHLRLRRAGVEEALLAVLHRPCLPTEGWAVAREAQQML